MTKTVYKNVKIALLRNTEDYFKEKKADFIPLKGEVVIIDLKNNETRAKVGDGITTLAKLPYTDETVRNIASGIVVQGYFDNGKFYQDASHKIKIIGYTNKVYIDIPTREVYGYFEPECTFCKISTNIPMADEKTAGISKLYQDLGQNKDGSISQSRVTDELNKKFTIALDHDEGLIFEDGIPDNEV